MEKKTSASKNSAGGGRRSRGASATRLARGGGHALSNGVRSAHRQLSTVLLAETDTAGATLFGLAPAGSMEDCCDIPTVTPQGWGGTGMRCAVAW